MINDTRVMRGLFLYELLADKDSINIENDKMGDENIYGKLGRISRFETNGQLILE